MQHTTDAIDFTPPDDTRWRGPLLLALAAHAVLVAALTWSIRWNTDTPQQLIEAELWTALPRVAAPKLVEPEPESVEPLPPHPPAPLLPERPQSAPPPQKPVVPQPSANDAQIALQKKKEEEQRRQDRLERERQAQEKKRQQEQREREEAQQREADKKREQLKKDEAARKKREAEAAEAKKRKDAEAAKEKARKEQAERDKAEKAKSDKEKAELAKKQDAAKRADDAKQQAQLEAERKKNLERMMGLAGASGGSNARGDALQSGGPSAGYGSKLVAKIKPNIVFTDSAPGNPRAEVEVYALPDGTITGKKLLKSSSNKTWDEAVLRAIDRTATLPRDENGKVPSTLILGFRPMD